MRTLAAIFFPLISMSSFFMEDGILYDEKRNVISYNVQDADLPYVLKKGSFLYIQQNHIEYFVTDSVTSIDFPYYVKDGRLFYYPGDEPPFFMASNIISLCDQLAVQKTAFGNRLYMLEGFQMTYLGDGQLFPICP